MAAFLNVEILFKILVIKNSLKFWRLTALCRRSNQLG